jgi:hypothetical protein
VLGRRNSSERSSNGSSKSAAAAIRAIALSPELLADGDRTLTPEEAEMALVAALMGEENEPAPKKKPPPVKPRNRATQAPSSALPALADDDVQPPPPTKPRRRQAAATAPESLPAPPPPLLKSRGSNTSILSTESLPASNPFSDDACAQLAVQPSMRSVASYSYLEEEGTVSAQELDGIVATPERLLSRNNTMNPQAQRRPHCFQDTSGSGSLTSMSTNGSIPEMEEEEAAADTPTTPTTPLTPLPLAAAEEEGQSVRGHNPFYRSPERLSAKRHTVAELGLATPSKRRVTRPGGSSVDMTAGDTYHAAASTGEAPRTPPHSAMHPHSDAMALATPHRGRRNILSPESKYVCSPGFRGTRAAIAARKAGHTLAQDRDRLQRIFLGATKMAVMFPDETDRIEPLYTRKAAEVALASLPALAEEEMTGAAAPKANTRTLRVLKLALPLHWWASIRFPERTSVFFFATLHCRGVAYATRMLRADGLHRPGELVFEDPLEFEGVGPDFAMEVSLYGYVYEAREEEPRSGMSTPKKVLDVGRRAVRRVRAVTPKKLQQVRHFFAEKYHEVRGHTHHQTSVVGNGVGSLTPSSSSGGVSTPAATRTHGVSGALSTDMPDFELIASARVTLENVQGSGFVLEPVAKTRRAYPIGEMLNIVTELGPLITVDTASYLSVLENRAWVRRWVAVESGFLRLYEEPKSTTPLVVVDLAHLTRDGQVVRRTRQECARPRAFDLMGKCEGRGVGLVTENSLVSASQRKAGTGNASGQRSPEPFSFFPPRHARPLGWKQGRAPHGCRHQGVAGAVDDRPRGQPEQPPRLGRWRDVRAPG